MEGTWLDRNRNILFGLISTIAVVGAGLFYVQRPSQEPIEILQAEATATSTPVPTPEATATPTPVRVYITGAVLNTDVYFLPGGSIVKDAIEAAGGLAPDANREGINLALELKDQQHIHVPRLGEENPPPPVRGGEELFDGTTEDTTPTQGQQININTATLEQLDSLPGVGPAIGKRIIDYRESVGGFGSIEEITQVSGIGEATFAKIRDLIVVE
jgi:competence protein ComEA